MKIYLTREQIQERIVAFSRNPKALTREQIRKRIKLYQELGSFLKNIRRPKYSIRDVS